MTGHWRQQRKYLTRDGESISVREVLMQSSSPLLGHIPNVCAVILGQNLGVHKERR